MCQHFFFQCLRHQLLLIADIPPRVERSLCRFGIHRLAPRRAGRHVIPDLEELDTVTAVLAQRFRALSLHRLPTRSPGRTPPAPRPWCDPERRSTRSTSSVPTGLGSACRAGTPGGSPPRTRTTLPTTCRCRRTECWPGGSQPWSSDPIARSYCASRCRGLRPCSTTEPRGRVAPTCQPSGTSPSRSDLAPSAVRP